MLLDPIGLLRGLKRRSPRCHFQKNPCKRNKSSSLASAHVSNTILVPLCWRVRVKRTRGEGPLGLRLRIIKKGYADPFRAATNVVAIECLLLLENPREVKANNIVPSCGNDRTPIQKHCPRPWEPKREGQALLWPLAQFPPRRWRSYDIRPSKHSSLISTTTVSTQTYKDTQQVRPCTSFNEHARTNAGSIENEG
jgi:hypothetical protein